MSSVRLDSVSGLVCLGLSLLQAQVYDCPHKIRRNFSSCFFFYETFSFRCISKL